MDTGAELIGPCLYGYNESPGFMLLNPSGWQVCANAASRSSVPFAYAWYVVYARSLPIGPFAYGLTEAFALLTTNDPILFPNQHVDLQEGHSYDFEGDPPVPRRSLADDCDSVGLCHEILAGIWWDIKLNMETKYEAPGADCPIEGLTGTACGLEVTRRLFVRWTLMTQGFDLHLGPDKGPTIALDLLATDDDNDDVSDGTPHFTEICTGFVDHRIGCPLDCNGNYVFDLDDPDPDENENGVPHGECDNIIYVDGNKTCSGSCGSSWGSPYQYLREALLVSGERTPLWRSG